MLLPDKCCMLVLLYSTCNMITYNKTPYNVAFIPDRLQTNVLCANTALVLKMGLFKFSKSCCTSPKDKPWSRGDSKINTWRPHFPKTIQFSIQTWAHLKTNFISVISQPISIDLCTHFHSLTLNVITFQNGIWVTPLAPSSYIPPFQFNLRCPHCIQHTFFYSLYYNYCILHYSLCVPSFHRYAGPQT